MYTLHQIIGWRLINHETINSRPIVIRVSFVKDVPGLPGASVSGEGETLTDAVANCRTLIRSMEQRSMEDTPERKVSLTQEIRAKGWAVGVHNDYRLHGVPCTFWLFTKGNLCVKGEGPTDEEALNKVREEIERIERKVIAHLDVSERLELGWQDREFQ